MRDLTAEEPNRVSGGSGGGIAGGVIGGAIGAIMGVWQTQQFAAVP